MGKRRNNNSEIFIVASQLLPVPHLVKRVAVAAAHR